METSSSGAHALLVERPDVARLEAQVDGSHMEALQLNVITALQGAFTRDWVERIREDMMTVFWSSHGVEHMDGRRQAYLHR
jgi:hypothetical protein